MILETRLLSVLHSLPDYAVAEEMLGRHVLAVRSRRTGLATWAAGDHLRAPAAVCGRKRPHSAADLARWLLDPDPAAASIGLAAFNSLLPPPPENELADINAGDLLLDWGADKNVVVVGRFPFVERLRRRFARLWVLEKQPEAGDLPAAAAGAVLPRADVVAVTATTLANHTLAELLAACRPDAVKLLIGPSTPLTPALFDIGFTVLAGSLVRDLDRLRASIRAGLPFKAFAGVRHVVWQRSAPAG